MDCLPKICLCLCFLVPSASGDIKRIPTPKETVLNCEKLAINPQINTVAQIFSPADNLKSHKQNRKIKACLTKPVKRLTKKRKSRGINDPYGRSEGLRRTRFDQLQPLSRFP